MLTIQGVNVAGIHIRSARTVFSLRFPRVSAFLPPVKDGNAEKPGKNEMNSTLTVAMLVHEAKDLARRESGHRECSLFGVTDGKAVGTYLELDNRDAGE